MAWNQPGKPTRPSPGPSPDRPRNSRPESGPPDPPGLEEVLDRLNRFFGQGMRPGRLLALALLALLLTWGGLGFRLVGGGEQAVVLREGRVQAVLTPGLHWAPPLLVTVIRVNVDELRQATLTTTVLTGDDNLADVTLDLQYRVADPIAYLFGFADAETVLLRVMDAELLKAMSALSLAELQQSPSLAPALRRAAEARLSRYRSGLAVTGVSLTAVAPPAEVGAVVEAASQAREAAAEQQARVRREIQQSLRAARAEAGRLLDVAARQNAGQLAGARNDAARFARDLELYRADPEAAQALLYQRAVADVMAHTRTVVVGEAGLGRLGIPAPQLQPSPLPPRAAAAPGGVSP